MGNAEFNLNRMEETQVIQCRDLIVTIPPKFHITFPIKPFTENIVADFNNIWH